MRSVKDGQQTIVVVYGLCTANKRDARIAMLIHTRREQTSREKTEKCQKTTREKRIDVRQ
jgi:hypothetical protein